MGPDTAGHPTLERGLRTRGAEHGDEVFGRLEGAFAEYAGAACGQGGAAVNAFVRQRLRPLPETWPREHLLAVSELIQAGQLTPVLDRSFSLAESAAGLRYLEEGHARGKVVITVP